MLRPDVCWGIETLCPTGGGHTVTERVLGSLCEHRDHACFSYLKTGSSAKGRKHLECGVSEGDPKLRSLWRLEGK